jgi:hypothetical protein
MEWTKASLVGMDLFNMEQFFYLKKKLFEEVICVAHTALKWKEFMLSP